MASQLDDYISIQEQRITWARAALEIAPQRHTDREAWISSLRLLRAQGCPLEILGAGSGISRQRIQVLLRPAVTA